MYPSTCRQCGLGFRQASHWRDKGLRHGTKFGVPVSEELVTVYVGLRGDAGQVKLCVPCRGILASVD